VVKGETSPAFVETKGGEYVRLANHELYKQHAFDSFCKKVLKNDMRNYYDEMARLSNKEVSFSELSERELRQLSTTDKYFSLEQTFNVLGCDIFVNNTDIAEALRSLPERKRDIILLFYFLELSDGEIGIRLKMVRSTVQYQRTRALQKLRIIMEGNGNGRKESKK